jgi:penicillin-binding protein 1A
MLKKNVSTPSPRTKFFLISGISIFALLLLTFLYFYLSLPNFDNLNNNTSENSSIIYSNDGIELGIIKSEKYQDLALPQEIPNFLLSTLVIIEDPNFYEHSGLNLIPNLKNFFSKRNVRSAISQKLVRLLYQKENRNIKNWLGSLKILFASVIVELKFSKKDILVHYLNHASFGGAIRGIKAAAAQYFNKKTEELSEIEGALLIGMLQAPSRYNPRKAPQRALARRNEVLQQMALANIIEPSLAAAYINQPLTLETPRQASVLPAHKAPYFLEFVKKWLLDWAKKNKTSPYGRKVFTTLNYRLQIHAESAVAQHLSYYQKLLDRRLQAKVPWEKDPGMLRRCIRRTQRYKYLKSKGYTEIQIQREFEREIPMRVFKWEKPGYEDKILSPLDSIKYYIAFLEAGLISIEAHSGNVRAWVGGVDYNFFRYDHVWQGKRQVGSTFKPFVYAAALEAGYEPCDTLTNQPLTIIAPDGDKWRPQNADFDYGGAVSLRYGLVHSMNVVTARLIQKVGTDKVIKLAQRLGIQTPLPKIPSIALGTVDLSVAELAYAYTPFVNGGLRYPFNVISKIENINGEIAYQYSPIPKRAIEPNVAYTMVELLRRVALVGTAGNARSIANLPYQLDIGGKTGTTQNNSDAWFVGFTPEIVTAVWVGCAERSVNFGNTEMGRGSYMALPIWSIFMHKAYNDPKIGWDINKKILPPSENYNVLLDCYNDPVKKVFPDSGFSEFDYSPTLADSTIQN